MNNPPRKGSHHEMINTTLTILSASQIRAYYAAGYWTDQTIYMAALEQARRNPQAYAIRDRRRRLTYGELIAAADGLAAELHAAGVRPGQRVGVWMPSRVETAIALLACSRNSYTCCPSLHRDHTAKDVAELMQRVRATAFIGEVGYGADGKKIDIFELLEGQERFRRLIRLERVTDQTSGIMLPSATTPQPEPSDDPNRVVYLAFTSGTTGQPKGVMHSDNTLLSNARAMAKDWSFGPESVLYTMSPLSHNLGFGAMVAAFASGAELVVHDQPRGSSILDRLLETGSTFLFGVPTHAIDLLSELRARKAANVGRLTGFRISGASAPKEVVAELLRYGVKPQSGYGMTEACSHHYTLPSDPPERIIQTSGKACENYEVKIWSIDDPEREAGPGEIGQIGGRGASLMLGYFDDQAATESSFNRSGWFMTGDLGKQDADGYLIVTGRKKELIIRGGHNIYPARIENLTLQHPAIARAAAVPVPDARLGEKVCLAYSLREGHATTFEDILRHLDASGLSRYDMPEYMIELQDIPLTASGKVYKRALVEDIQHGRLQVTPVRFQPEQMA
ncbi:class I adenylate-forming enzyme family protein [uncultured Pigmentiphaga sp.]|uniref:class I adenylate-forming enzyme family protein n=1 Tax=uncultured Pigmentiphaga sp. TaxID=340361 RepID=UPI00261C52F7|nr:class I adenylate-forming enzyme family protein [uncultured Pigmentiphaga sp.]